MKKVKIGIIETEVPDHINHIRIDKSGEICGYFEEPNISNYHKYWAPQDGTIYLIAEFADGVSNWDEIKIDWEEDHWVERIEK